MQNQALGALDARIPHARIYVLINGQPQQQQKHHTSLKITKWYMIKMVKQTLLVNDCSLFALKAKYDDRNPMKQQQINKKQQFSAKR